MLDSKAQKELSHISGGLHGTEKADRIESIIMRMSEQGQLRGRKVRRHTYIVLTCVRGLVQLLCRAGLACFICWLWHVESERACVRERRRKTATIVFTPQAFSLPSPQVTIELIYKLHDVVSKQYESGSKSSMKFSRKEAEDSDSESDSD